MSFMSPTIRSSRAFTLIELLVVISIIGLLSSVVLAGVNGARAKGSIAAGQNFDGHTYAAFYDDLVLSWDFDNDSAPTVQDQAANGNSLSLSTALTIAAPPVPNPFKIGKVLDINTAAIPSQTASMTGIRKYPTGNFSILFWLYPKTNQATDYISFYASPINGVWKFGYQDPANGFVFTFFSTLQRTVKNLPIEFNQWSHIALVCSNGRIGVYVNGKLVGQDSNVVTCTFPSDSLTRTLNLAGGFQYHMDNIRIYAKELPLSFIQEQYFATVPMFNSLALNVMMQEK